MRLSNRSSRTNAELIELITYVRRYSRCSNHVKVTVYDKGPDTMHGLTRKLMDPSAMIQVIVYVSPESKFPYTTQYMPETPRVSYRNWKDHFVITLAHEFKHAWQFETMDETEKAMFRDDISKDTYYRETEIEAETFGAQVLQQYQLDTK